MSTLQTIREKLRALPFDTPAVPVPPPGSSVSGGMSSWTVCIIVGLVIGGLVTLALVKLWLLYRDKGTTVPAHTPMPSANDYVAQLAQRIRQSPEPALRPVIPTHTVHPVAAPPRQEELGEWPRPEGSAAPVAQEAAPPPLPDDTENDPYFTPI